MKTIKVNKIVGYKRWIAVEVVEGSEEHKELIRWNRAMNYVNKQDKKEMEVQNAIAENEISAEQMNEETGFEFVDVDEPSPEEWCIKMLRHEELMKAITQLTPRQQEIVHLVFWEGKGLIELSKIYDCSKPAITQAVNRITDSLRKILEKTNLFSD